MCNEQGLRKALDADGARAVHGCEGAGAVLRTYLRSFRRYVSTFDAIKCVGSNLGELQPFVS